MITAVLSLDTELAWGRLSPDKKRPLLDDESAGRDAIKYVLDILEEYQIPATWGVVGHLLLEECDADRHYSAPYIEAVDPRTGHEVDPLYYAPEVLDWIQSADVDHEIAGHSFSHPRFGDLERSDARAELEAMVEVFEDRGVNLDSMIHPGIDLAHLDLLPEFGIKRYSGAGQTRNYTLRKGVSKLLHRDPALLDAPLVETVRDKHGLLCIQRSRSLRDERRGWLNPYRVRRALRSNDDGILHLSFHPHNVVYDRFLRRTLPTVADILAKARDAGDVEIATFRGVAEART